MTPQRSGRLRRITWGLVALVTAVSVGLMFSGDSLVRVGGTSGLFGCCAFAWFLWQPAGRGSPAEAVSGGLLLPSRAASRPVLGVALSLLAVGSLGVAIEGLNTGEPLFGRRSPAHAFLTALALAVLGPVVLGGAALGRGRVRLDPSGVGYERLAGRSTFIAWRDIDKVELDPVWGKSLALQAKRWTNAQSMKIPLHFQTWPAEAVADAIRWYAGHAGARQNLTDPEALERWRPQPEWD